MKILSGRAHISTNIMLARPNQVNLGILIDGKIPGEVLLEALCFFAFESRFDETCSFSLLLKSLNKDTVGDLPQGKVSS